MSITALSTAATGMTSLQQEIDVIANNLANVNTTGFKRLRADFHDLFYQHLRRVGSGAASGSQVPSGIQIGHGVKMVGTDRMFGQGPMSSTERELDLAIDGEGFFQVRQLDGNTIGYTRDGTLHRDRDGNIVNADGMFFEPTLTVPPEVTRISISPDGHVEGFDPSNPTTPVSIGDIEIARFSNPEGLIAIGENMYLETQASGAPEVGKPGETGRGTLQQGFLESSNVEAVRELTDMIQTQRAFELNSTTIKTADEMLQTLTTLRR
ncbi:MAG: flagellar basal-body rod protein FlgG [Planctomycetes bacterium]|nr:flagellar basal-body rod protein FlgG [Planctomycetota bacterium]